MPDDMTVYELTAIIIAVFSGLGTFVAWLINQERLNKIEKQADTANRIANQANELSNTANLISRQALGSQVHKFRSEKLDKISREFDNQLKTLRSHNYRSVERRNLLMKGMYPFLVNVNKFEVSLYHDETMKDRINHLLVDLDEFFHLSFEYEIASEDYKSVSGSDNLYVILNIKENPELKAAAELRSSTAKALREKNKLIESTCKQLLEQTAQELDESLKEATKLK